MENGEFVTDLESNKLIMESMNALLISAGQAPKDENLL